LPKIINNESRRRAETKVIKGMTRRIVEIKQPQSNYFEKAVFYCRTNMPAGTSEYSLTEEATRIIESLCLDGKAKRKHSKEYMIVNFFKMILYVAVGAVGTFLLLKYK
jgi:hypothetical protein